MIRFLLIFLAVAMLSGCTPPEKADFEQAQKYSSQGEFKLALGLFDRVIKRNSGSDRTIEAAREAARISFYETKEYKRAANYFKLLVLHAKDPQERLQSQKQVAGIYFDDLQNYNQSIMEFSRLLEMPHSDLDEAQYRLSLARSYFYLAEYFQSLSEIDNLLKGKNDEASRFNALVLKGNILVGQKKYTEAVEVFRKVMADFPAKALKENVGLILAVCYEESGDFKGAIRILEEYRGKYSPPEYIELRIKKLQERLRNAPGAKGFRK
jgi:tetratricopeptide (TPR) repeat protein